MKIYTRTGDGGKTALFGGGRVSKSHPRIEACGGLDELNAELGRTIPALVAESSRARLTRVQHDLFTLGAYLAAPLRSDGTPHGSLPDLPSARHAEMEDWIDEADAELDPLDTFILPGGGEGARALHVCRTVCRRAERAIVRLSEHEGADVRGTTDYGLRYLNRLSDLLFMLARLENRRSGVDDVRWERETR